MIEGEIAVYEVEIMWLMEQANEGKISKAEFRRKLAALVGTTLLLAFLIAGGDVGNKAGMREVDRITKLHKGSISKLSRDVYSGEYQTKPGEVTHEDALTKMMAKVALWGTTAYGIYNLGKAYHREPERRFEWRWGDTIKHCKHCAEQHGKIRTSIEWRKLHETGIFPQSPRLECKGWNCRCQLIEVDPIVNTFEDAIKARAEV